MEVSSENCSGAVPQFGFVVPGG